jgi:outer membrane biosynthesis protein TonB
MIESSGFPGYDQRVAAALAAWSYQPIEIGGRPAVVCTVVTIAFRSN